MHHVDWLATLRSAALAGGALDAAYDSRDHWAALRDGETDEALEARALVLAAGDGFAAVVQGGYKYMYGFDTFGFYNVTAYDQIQCWPGDASEAWLFDLRDDPRETANVDDDEARARLAAVAAAAVDDAYVPQHAFGTEEGNGAVFRHFQSAGGFVSPFGCAVNYLR
ncbi:sulfuric ester hydrolase [Aureococcus anophagefferens]|uniref:Sulfuric ester hydrolase n=1 Tax=Aureococcus anophagefferens TaxID=44056 RepID=A0ABR1G620_AURAN